MRTPPQFDYAARQARLREALACKKLDALLVTHMPNVRYLCGFTGSAGVLLIGSRRSVFITDGRYREQAGEEVRGVRVWVPKGGNLEAAAKAAGALQLKSLAIEADHMPVASRERLVKLLPHGTRVRSVSGAVEALRMIKDELEVELLRRAVLLASSLFKGVLRNIRPGTSELAVSAELEYAARQAGAEGMSFETIVAAGPRSALPHGRASMQPVPRTGFVVLDFGVILAGYCSDMTRTVHVGRPSARARAMYDAVLQAQQAGLEAVRPGTTANQVDLAARSVLRRAGFGGYFTHSTGHGVGLEIHEAPRLGKGQREFLRPGMVVTIEPGVYIPGLGGVRIEDMVAVTDSGHEVLTPTPKELITL
jgi:Xaa-Pro aminopeptidase